MPFYEYACEACGTPFEVRRSIAAHRADPAPPCPACASREVRRVYSPPALRATGDTDLPARPAPRGQAASPAPRPASPGDGPRVRDIIPGYRPGGGCGHSH